MTMNIMRYGVLESRPGGGAVLEPVLRVLSCAPSDSEDTLEESRKYLIIALQPDRTTGMYQYTYMRAHEEEKVLRSCLEICLSCRRG